MSQITAGLNKEWLFFFRKKRFLGMLIIFIGCAVIYPLMARMTLSIPQEMRNVQGIEMDVFSMFESLDAVYILSISMITFAGFMTLFLMSNAAGGEQKKRSIILPQTAGLTPVGYVLPKFMFYPLMLFIMSIISAFAANEICRSTFGEAYSFEMVMVTGALYGLYVMFFSCLYLFFGISLAQPKLSVVYVIASDTVFDVMINEAFGISRYTPWNLVRIANKTVANGGTSNSEVTDIAVTAVIVAVICVALMLLTLFSVSAKRMDNTNDEVY
jgi:ABC-2 type transport system permease protein